MHSKIYALVQYIINDNPDKKNCQKYSSTLGDVTPKAQSPLLHCFFFQFIFWNTAVLFMKHRIGIELWTTTNCRL